MDSSPSSTTMAKSSTTVVAMCVRKGCKRSMPIRHPLNVVPVKRGTTIQRSWVAPLGVYDPHHLRFLRRPGQGQESLLAYRHVAIGVAQRPLVRQGAEPMGPEGG